MTTIDSLEIRGIRSFAPDRTESLDFDKPLTLIVGKNGTGKTTIVECLKAVTCGILPPGQGKGRTFIFNNKLNKCSEVKGSIKMTFHTHNNENVHASRAYSVSCDRYDPQKLTFKGTDSSLNIVSEDGRVKCLAMKTTDMDMTVPTLMGMSRALLDNVIFCHQDENNWPLDEPSKIKSRFDDLLETSRFTKALQSLNKSKKEQEDMISTKKAKLDAYKSQILQIADLRKEIETNKEDMDKTKEEIKSLEEEYKQKNEVMTAKMSEYEEVADVNDEYTSAKQDYERFKEECDRLQEQLTEMYEEPLEEMEKFHKILSKELKTSESKQSSLAKKIEQISEKLNKYHEKLRNITSSASTLFILKEKQSLNEKEMEETVKELCFEFSMDASEFNEETVRSKIESLSNASKPEEKLNKEVAKLEADINKHNESILNKKGKPRSNSVSAELGAFKVVQSGVESQLSELETVLREFDEASKSRDDCEKQLDGINKEIEQLEQKLKDLVTKKDKVLSQGFGIKNMIKAKWEGNEEEIRGGITILNYIIENDKEATDSYKEVMEKHHLNEKKLLDLVKKICKEVSIKEDVFLQDTKRAVVELVHSSRKRKKTERTGNKTDSKVVNQEFEPYNELVKTLTNKRIKEYIVYLSDILKEKKGQKGQESLELDNYNTILEEIARVNEELSNKRESLEENRRELEKLTAQVDKMNESKTKEGELETQKRETNKKISKLTKEVEELQTKFENVNSKLKEKKNELSEMENERKENHNKYRMLYDKYQSNLETKKQLELQMEELPDEGNEDLNELNVDIDKQNDQMKKYKDSQSKVLEEINEKKTLIKQLEDNIQYKSKFKELEEKLSNMNMVKLKLEDKDVETIQKDLEKITKECSELSHKIATMNGMVMTREEHVSKLKKMLESELFSKAQSQYMETYIELKSHIIAKMDLEKYSKYLESSLHTYHLKKINHINSVLKRIWREVYTGNHIDYIEIQSKVDKDLSPLELESHSYNYRVVMVTPSGVEMDMKGHCSAGERLLCSLVVRMSLIECFSDNCSILALDEPTANLDKENIQSLENSLSRLVNESNLNFQLILITHDETFATKMATLCSCDKYFKLEKKSYYTEIKTVTF